MEIYRDGYGHGGSDHTFMWAMPARNLIAVLIVQMHTVDEKRFATFYSTWKNKVRNDPLPR